MKVLILGGTGLLGNALLKILSKKFTAIGTTRVNQVGDQLNYVLVKDILDKNNLNNLIIDIKPDVVINCLSLRNFMSSSYTDLKLMYISLPQILTELSIKFKQKHLI